MVQIATVSQKSGQKNCTIAFLTSHTEYVQ